MTNTLEKGNVNLSMGGDPTTSSPDQRGLARSALLIAILIILTANVVFASALHYEIWDGTIFDYWLSTHDFRGIDVWYRESNGFITLWLMRTIQLSDGIIALIANTKAFNILAIVLYPLGAFMVLRFVGASVHERLLAVLVISLSPTLLLYVSIMNALIMIYIAFCWIGLSLLERPGIRKIIALMLIVISCQLWSNYAVVIAFLAWRSMQQRQVKWEYIAAALMSSGVIYFLLFYLQLTGNYNNYNSFDLSIIPLARKLFSSTFAIGFWPVFAIYVSVTAAFGFMRRQFVASHWQGIVGVAIFYIAAAIPYIAVDKPPPLFGLLVHWDGVGEFLIGDNFDYRHLLPAYCWIGLAIAATIMRITEIAAAMLGSRVTATAGALIAVSLFMMTSSVVNTAIFARHLWERDAETVALSRAIAISCNPEMVEGCVVDLSTAPRYLADNPRQYELNYLYFKAFGKLGAVDSSATPGHAREFAKRYSCRSEAHALAYVTPFEMCALGSK